MKRASVTRTPAPALALALAIAHALSASAAAGVEPTLAYESAGGGLSIFADLPFFTRGSFAVPLSGLESSIRLGALYRGARALSGGSEAGAGADNLFPPTLPSYDSVGLWSEARQTLAGSRSYAPLRLDMGLRHQSSILWPSAPLPAAADYAAPPDFSHEHGLAAFVDFAYRDRPYFPDAAAQLRLAGAALLGAAPADDPRILAVVDCSAAFRVPLVRDYLGLATAARYLRVESLSGQAPLQRRAGAFARGLGSLWGDAALSASAELRGRYPKLEIPYLAGLELAAFADGAWAGDSPAAFSVGSARLSLGGELSLSILSPYGEHAPALVLSAGAAMDASGLLAGSESAPAGTPLPYLSLRAYSDIVPMLVALAASFF